MESTQGGFTVEELAEFDRIRREQQASKKQNTRNKRGHKGSRQWGFATQSGKRRRD